MKNRIDQKIAGWILIFLNGFLAVTALAGGIGLIFGLNDPSGELLRDSVFTSFMIPGLALLVFVGGSALTAAIQRIRKHPSGLLASLIAGIMILCLETMEVSVIGSPAGIARNLQIFYFFLGLFIIAVVILSRNKENSGKSFNPLIIKLQYQKELIPWSIKRMV